MSQKQKLKEWFLSLDPKVQKWLDPWKELTLPTTEYQYHYSTKDLEPVLGLSPVTIRQYIREEKIFGRKLNNQWQIPTDSVVRYLYNNSHEHTAKKFVPMGIVFFKSTETLERIGYEFCSDYEMEKFSSTTKIKEIFGYTEGGIYPEVFPVHGFGNILEEINLIIPNFEELKDRKAKLQDKEFDIPNNIINSLKELAFSSWEELPLSIIENKFREMFKKEPNTIDLKLLKIILNLLEKDNYSNEEV